MFPNTDSSPHSASCSLSPPHSCLARYKKCLTNLKVTILFMQMPWHNLDVFRASVNTPHCPWNDTSIVVMGTWWSKIKFVMKLQQGAPCVCSLQPEERAFPLNSTEWNLMQESRKVETYKKATVHMDWIFPPTLLHLNLLQTHPTSTRVPHPGNTSLPSSIQEQGSTRCSLPTRSNSKSPLLELEVHTQSEVSHSQWLPYTFL